MTKLTRSEFLKLANRFFLVTGITVVVGPVIAYFFPRKLEEVPSEPVLVCPEEELPLGAGKVVRFGRYPALVIHTEGGLKAYSAVCTHFACICKWEPAQNMIVCPCHDGYFSPQDGSVVSGPPPTPLTELVVRVVDGMIYVGGLS